MLDADDRDLAEDAAVAGEDLTGSSEYMRTRFLDRVAVARSRDSGMEQMILTEVGATLTALVDYDETLTTIADLAVRYIAQMCVVLTTDGETTSPRLTVASAERTHAAACRALQQWSIDPFPSVTQLVLETRRPQLFDESGVTRSESSDELRRVLRDLDLRSGIAVPLLSGDDVVGVIALASSITNGIGARDIGLTTEFAFRAVLALESVRRHKAEQRAIQARDEILGIVAHDLRSPLHSINLAAQLLERKLAKAGGGIKYQNDLELIRQSVVRANRLIQDLLDVTRMEGGGLSLVHQVVETRPVVLDAVGSLHLRASEESVELRFDVAQEVPAIWADRDRIVQVLENLIGNAIKFTREGGVVTVGAVAGNGVVTFSVVDTGTGIPSDSIEHVFDRFWQADKASTRGVGLGLPICKGIIEAHGGRIWAESTLGRGSTFYFTVPTTT